MSVICLCVFIFYAAVKLSFCDHQCGSELATLEATGYEWHHAPVVVEPGMMMVMVGDGGLF